MDKLEHKLALIITKWMNKFYPRDAKEQVVIVYGIEVFIDNIFKLLVYLLVAIYLGILKESVIMFLLFTGLRKSAGGMHFDKNIVCFLFTGIVIVGGAFISRIITINYFIWSILLILAGLILLKYAPSGTKKNPILPEKIKPLKIKTVITFLIYVVIAVILNKSTFSNMVLIISLVVSTTLLPIVNRKYKV